MANKMVKQWFVYAARDLAIAKKTLEFSAEYKNIAGFHAQQCVEKAVKGFLVFNQVRPPKTHSLEELAKLVADLDPKLAKLLLKNQKLSFLAVVYRYPDAEKKPLTVKVVKSAIKNAELIFSKCRDLSIDSKI